MANPKHAEAREHEDRRQRFMAAFKNAAEVLDQYKRSAYFKTFPDKGPDHERGWELRAQFFMARALGDKPHERHRLEEKIEAYLNQEQRKTFTRAYMDNQYTYGDYAERLEPMEHAA